MFEYFMRIIFLAHQHFVYPTCGLILLLLQKCTHRIAFSKLSTANYAVSGSTSVNKVGLPLCACRVACRRLSRIAPCRFCVWHDPVRVAGINAKGQRQRSLAVAVGDRTRTLTDRPSIASRCLLGQICPPPPPTRNEMTFVIVTTASQTGRYFSQFSPL